MCSYRGLTGMLNGCYKVVTKIYPMCYRSHTGEFNVFIGLLHGYWKVGWSKIELLLKRLWFYDHLWEPFWKVIGHRMFQFSKIVLKESAFYIVKLARKFQQKVQFIWIQCHWACFFFGHHNSCHYGHYFSNGQRRH